MLELRLLTKWAIRDMRDNPRHNDSVNLRSAMAWGYADIVELFIRHGCDMRANYDQCLQFAADHARPDLIRLAILHGCEIDESLSTSSLIGAGSFKKI